jgi:pilus assembly protein CpaB
MSSSALRIVAILLVIGAAILGYMGYQVSHTPVPIAAEPHAETIVEPVRIPIVVAAKDIAPDQMLDMEDITVIYINDAEQQQVIGLTTRMAISSGDMLLPEHFQTLSAVTANLHPGERAVAVKVDEVTGAGGFIEPGDKVDVLLFLPAGPETARKSSAQLLLPAIRVLAYGNQLDELDQQQIRQKSRSYLANQDQASTAMLAERDSQNNSDKPTGKQSKTAVLAVAQESVSTLLLAESTGRIRLALLGEELTSDNNGQVISTSEKAHFVSMDNLTATEQPTEQISQPQTTAPAVPKISPKNTPAQIVVHRGAVETQVNIELEK